MQKLRLHVVGLPHTIVTKKLPYLPCAYTQKVLNLCKMMTDLGNDVYLYGGGSYTDAPCNEFISIFNEIEQEKYFGKKENWLQGFFNISWDPKLEYWQEFNKRVSDEIKKRADKTDIICIIGGNCQAQISYNLPNLLCCECGIGYEGVFSKYKIFESYSHMHYVSGLMKKINGDFYDCVIPNYFDPNDFEFSKEKDDYFLYIGRLVSRKGPNIAAEVCNEIGAKLVLAGQGVTHKEPNKIVSQEITIVGNDIEHVGVLGLEERSKLMSRAKAVFVPTLYFGPFEGVSMEALMCGTPIITTNFGCFTENNIHGKTGFRCTTFEQFVWAAKNIDKISPEYCREYAVNNFSIDRIKYMYQEYFEQLVNLWKAGWYERNESRDNLDWLNRIY